MKDNSTQIIRMLREQNMRQLLKKVHDFVQIIGSGFGDVDSERQTKIQRFIKSASTYGGPTLETLAMEDTQTSRGIFSD